MSRGTHKFSLCPPNGSRETSKEVPVPPKRNDTNGHRRGDGDRGLQMQTTQDAGKYCVKTLGESCLPGHLGHFGAVLARCVYRGRWAEAGLASQSPVSCTGVSTWGWSGGFCGLKPSLSVEIQGPTSTHPKGLLRYTGFTPTQ